MQANHNQDPHFVTMAELQTVAGRNALLERFNQYANMFDMNARSTTGRQMGYSSVMNQRLHYTTNDGQ